MIGNLLYLIVSHPDITLFVGVCACYKDNPNISHLTRAKRIIKYISGTSDYDLLYYFDTNSSLVGYCDADWVDNAEDRKSISGGFYFLGNKLISWFSKKQNYIPFLTTKSGYIVVGTGCTQLL